MNRTSKHIAGDEWEKEESCRFRTSINETTTNNREIQQPTGEIGSNEGGLPKAGLDRTISLEFTATQQTLHQRYTPLYTACVCIESTHVSFHLKVAFLDRRCWLLWPRPTLWLLNEQSYSRLPSYVGMDQRTQSTSWVASTTILWRYSLACGIATTCMPSWTVPRGPGFWCSLEAWGNFVHPI